MKYNLGLEYHKGYLLNNMAKSFNVLSSTTTVSGSHHTTTQITSTTTVFDTNNNFLDHGYVEWYWVALGLIVPVLLGTLFCVLDHMRRKKRVSSKHNEERLESMCERNKYVPPSYDEIIPNNLVIIEPVPEFTLPPPGLQSTNIPVFTIESESTQQTAAVSSNKAAPVLPQQLTITAQVDNSNDCAVSVNSSTHLTVQSPTISQAPSSVFTDNSSVFEDVDLTDAVVEAPPSYDEYHKYELFGSRVELV